MIATWVICDYVDVLFLVWEEAEIDEKFTILPRGLQFTHLSANASKNLVPDVCRETISYAGCMHALQSDPRAKTASNFMDLAKIALQLGLKNAIDSKAYIDGLLKKNHAAPIEKCSFWYEAVVGSFRSALSELEEDALTANYDVKIAGDDAASCENELASGGVKVPSISARNNDVALYSNIGDVITNKL